MKRETKKTYTKPVLIKIGSLIEATMGSTGKNDSGGSKGGGKS